MQSPYEWSPLVAQLAPQSNTPGAPALNKPDPIAHKQNDVVSPEQEHA